MPIGWPSAMAPPFTFTLSWLTPRSFIDCTATAANASLISMRSRSATVRPAFPSAWPIALAGCDWRELSGPATFPCGPISASQDSPSSSALARDMTTTAAAPSEICEEEPAVIVPSPSNAGRSAARDSTVVSGRMPSSSVNITGSPLRCGIATGTISASKIPFFLAAAARWWERAATASCSSRVMDRRVLCRSVEAPIATPSNGSVSPSYAMASSISIAPYLKPARDFGSRWGALVIDS